PEVRLDIGEPDLDIGNVETVLETLSSSCYYLTVSQNRFRFSLAPNLNKLLADRRAAVQTPKIDEIVKAEIQKVFTAKTGVERVWFPERTNSIMDRPTLTFVVLSPEVAGQDTDRIKKLVEGYTKECGSSART